MTIKDIEQAVVSVQDFPKPGIGFKDLTPLFLDPKKVAFLVDEICKPFRGLGITKVVGVESRGFLLGALMAQELNAGLVLTRKPGKLPRKILKETYALEYGEDTLEMHEEDIQSGDLVLIHDDVLATGGTASAVEKMVTRAGGKVVGFGFICELAFLAGRKKLRQNTVNSLIEYS